VGDAGNFSQAHIPGAVLVEPTELVDGRPPANGRLPSTERLISLFSRLGYTPDMKIVLYDEEGGGWAGRMGWTLDIIGHDDWTYLDGGIHSWHAAGFPLESGDPPTIPPSDVSLTFDMHPVAEVSDLLDAIKQGSEVIWDVRSAEEYAGLKSGSARAGHIPGAVHLDWLELKDPNRSLRLAQELPALLAAHGVTGEVPIITHCQTHHRSGLSYMVGRLLGYEIRAYHGSWAEWGNREDTPIETGR
jgi:thiosulfate/3-mercaptopyruvate sulfurtransferase